MPNGILVIDKPGGWTSMDVCAKLRGMLHEKRVGHAGTLDPMATGVLPVFVGRATRAVEFASDSDKEYIAGLKLGVITNTQDITGEVLEKRPVCVDRDRLWEVLEEFQGDILQVPPMYSAIKRNGKKLYELARKGQEVERPPRKVRIHALGILDEEQTPTPSRLDRADYTLRVRCSKGTYVRTLCHDIGQSLGCGGCMSALRRTEAAGFSLAEAVTLDAVQAAVNRGEAESLLLPVDQYFARCGWPGRAVLRPEAERRLRSGAPVGSPGIEGDFRVYSESGAFLALARSEGGRMRVLKRFFDP